MKKVTFVFLLVLFSLSNNLCSQNTKISYHSTESRDFEPRQGVIITPLLADLQIITSTSVCDSIDFSILISSIAPQQIETWISEFKKQAMSSMLKKYKADAIIGALTEVQTSPDGYMRIIIMGYPAKYTNFRPATADDVWMVTLYDIIDKNSTEISDKKVKTVIAK